MSPKPWRSLFDKVAPFILVIIAVIAIAAAVGTYSNTQADHRQDVQRIDDTVRANHRQNELIACFNRFATALAGGLPPVRKASAVRDDALTKALVGKGDGSLLSVLVRALDKTAKPADVRRLVKLLNDYRRAGVVLQHVRARNPYPPPPTTFCQSAD